MRKIASILVVLLVTGVLSAWAGPLVPAHVPGEAKWVTHLDIAAIMALPIVKECVDKCGKDGRIYKKLMKSAEKIGLDPWHDVLGFTAFSPKYGRDAGVLMFHLAKMDKEKLTAYLKEKRPEHKIVAHGDHTIYTWTMKHYGAPNPAAGAFFGDNMVILGRGETAVKEALDVLTKKLPGLAEAAPLLKGVNANSLFLCSAIDVPDAYRPLTLCPVLRHCQSAVVQLAEKDGKLSCSNDIQTTSPETAKLFVQASDGVKAMIALRFIQADLINKILAGINYQADGAAFTYAWEFAIADLQAVAAMLKQAWAPPPAK